MNKIYKVVWSKAKHCYVVTSELAKRQTKSCSVRSLRMAALSMGVAAALIGGVCGSVAEASYVKVGDTYYAYTGGDGGRYFRVDNLYWNPSGKNLTITADTTDDLGNAMTVDSTTVEGSDSISVKKGSRYIFGNVAYGSADGTHVIVCRNSNGDGGTMTVNEKKAYIYLNPAYAARYGAHGAVSGYGVTVDIGNGNRVANVYGGVSSDDDVSNNKVDFKSGLAEYAYGGYIHQDNSSAKGNVTENSVSVNGGTVNGVYGGTTDKGNATANSVTVNDGEVTFYYGMIMGGDTYNGDAYDNTVTINGGSLVNKSGLDIIGGQSEGAGSNATGNKVIINNGTIGSDEGSQYENGFYVIAGWAGGGNAAENTVTIKGGKFASQKNFEILGGKAYTKPLVFNSTEPVTAAVTAQGNKVAVSGGTFSKNITVYGGFGGAEPVIYKSGTVSATATVKGNAVEISGGTYSGDVTVYGGYEIVRPGAFGGSTGSAAATGTVNGNIVEISGGTYSGAVTVYGGYADSSIPSSSSSDVTETVSATVENNKVIISGSKVTGNVYGGAVGRKPTGDGLLEDKVIGDATGNKVEVSGGEITGTVYGGSGSISSSTPGAAKENTVTITNGVVGGEVAGGVAGNFTQKNSVTVSGGEVSKVSGSVNHGFGENPAASQNQVIINGTAQVKGSVYGARDGYEFGYGSAVSTENTVTIDGSAVVTGSVYGAYGYKKDKTNNKVYIKNGTVNDGVFGGYCGIESTSDPVGNADGNEVQITGGTVNGSIVGGSGVASASGNTVTIKDNAEIGADTTITGGSAMHVNSYWKNVDGTLTRVTDIILGDASNNTVNIEKAISVASLSGGEGDETKSKGNKLNIGAAGVQAKRSGNFQTVALTEALPWENGKTVLSVDNFDASDSLKASLDISAASNLAAATSGQMTLLASQTDNDLNALSLTYAGGTATLNAEKQSQVVKEDAVASTDKGVTVNTQAVHTVSLDAANSYKNVVYSAVNQTKSLTFDEVTFAKNGTARDLANAFVFDNATVLDATNLKFKETNETIAKGDSMVLAAGAKGLAADTEITEPEKTIAIKFEDKQAIQYGATASGNVTTVAGAVKYTVDSVTLDTVELAGWTGTMSDVKKETKSWTVTDGTQVNTDGISVSDMNPGDSRTVLTADSAVQFATKHLTGGNVWKDGGAIDDSGDKTGVKIEGSSTGGGVKVDDTNASQLVYQQSKNDVTGVTLGTVKYDTTKAVRTFGNAYDLTKADINAKDFKLSNLEEVKSNMKTDDTMIVVDAEKAIANAKGETLKGFTSTPDPITVDFKDEKVDGKELTFEGTHKDTLSLNDKKTQVVYKIGEKEVNKSIAFTGEVAWSDSEAYYDAAKGTAKYKFAAANIDATDLKVTGTTDKALAKGDAMTLLTAEGLTATLAKDQSDANKKASKITVNYSDTASGIALGAEATGEVKAAANAVNYEISDVTMNSVDLAGWDGKTASAVPNGWTLADGASVEVDTDSMTVPTDVTYGNPQNILTVGSAIFTDDNITGKNKYGETALEFTDTDNKSTPAVTVSGTQDAGVKAGSDGKSLVYEVGKKDVSSVSLGAVKWASGATLLDASDKAYNFADITSLDGSFAMSYEKPEDVAATQSMTLLKANETLQDIVKEETKTTPYENVKAASNLDVLVNGAITGKLSKSGNNIVFTATENKATALTFGKVEWTGDTALIDHSKTLTNVSFDGATVDTSGIDFYKEMYIEADQQMTLVSNFGGEANITPESTKYMVGTAYEGESETKMEGNNLIIRTTTAAGLSEQTHKTVMAMEAGVALLAGGSEHVGKALESLGDAANQGSDGTSVGVSIGGSGNRYETGSHVNVNAWNAALAIGAKRELKQGALEYGVFGEYGKGSYKLYNDDGGRGDGDAHYAGGGLMAKWMNSHDVYAEASFRLGRMSDNADNILEGGGNKYGYDVHANYYGAHVGIGKVFRYKGGKSLDVYGKYFYTKRDGVEYDAKQHYNLDAVASSVLRIGARYGSTDKLWNWYGGLAYEYEFDGEATGTVNGTAIRAASIKGSSVRGELGMKMSATKDNPWQADISIYGYGGKHRGFGGNVSVAYTF